MSQAHARRASGQHAWTWDAFEREPRPLARRSSDRPARRASGPAPGAAEVRELRPGAQPRRTVRIAGQPTPPRRRPRLAARPRIGARPDRFAAWAVALGLFMAGLAAATAHADPPAPGKPHAPHALIR